MTQDKAKIPDWELKRRQKISQTLKGRKTWNKGKTAKDDPRIARVWLGKKLSEDHRNNISLGNKGKKMSDEAKRKIRLSKLGKKNPMFGKKQSPEFIEKRISKIRGRKNTWLEGEKSPFWKGGIRHDRGYRYIRKKDHPHAIGGYVAEHRLKMEEKQGIILTSKDVVHHKDQNRANNSIENLDVMDRKEHSKLHRKSS